ncbi:hypothetical protein FPV67DRAFT_1454678 [Lyophyllum atratum]|nr:hypothetical protein FPV67DRAFT_1454678 [Lyophyllum atratum]
MPPRNNHKTHPSSSRNRSPALDRGANYNAFGRDPYGRIAYLAAWMWGPEYVPGYDVQQFVGVPEPPPLGLQRHTNSLAFQPAGSLHHHHFQSSLGRLWLRTRILTSLHLCGSAPVCSMHSSTSPVTEQIKRRIAAEEEEAGYETEVAWPKHQSADDFTNTSCHFLNTLLDSLLKWQGGLGSFDDLAHTLNIIVPVRHLALTTAGGKILKKWASQEIERLYTAGDDFGNSESPGRVWLSECTKTADKNTLLSIHALQLVGSSLVWSRFCRTHPTSRSGGQFQFELWRVPRITWPQRCPSPSPQTQTVWITTTTSRRPRRNTSFVNALYGGPSFFDEVQNVKNEFLVSKMTLKLLTPSDGDISLCNNFQRLLLMRLFAEATFYPFYPCYLSLWYARKEIGLRITWLNTGNMLAADLRRVLATGILRGMEGTRGIQG